LATDQSISSGGWVGLGTSSSSSQFVRSTVTLPVNATIIGLILNIRDNVLATGDTVTATVYTSACGFAAPTTTGITAVVTGPSTLATPNCLATGVGSVALTQGTLVSVQITTSSGVGALSSGVAVTVFLQLP
jgi:hypothetical protein